MPMFRLVYLRTIMATMSVPPLEASRWNKIAEPMAGSSTAKHNSSSGWFVSGWSSGQKRSMTLTARDSTTEQYTVLNAKLRPRKMNPTTSSAMLMMNTKALGVSTGEGKTRPRISERPLTPPVEKLFGNLKK